MIPAISQAALYASLALAPLAILLTHFGKRTSRSLDASAFLLYGQGLLFASYALVGGSYVFETSESRTGVVNQFGWLALVGIGGLAFLLKRPAPPRRLGTARRIRVALLCLIASQIVSALFIGRLPSLNLTLPAIVVVMVLTEFPFASGTRAVEVARRTCMLPVLASLATFVLGFDWAVVGDARRVPAPFIGGRLTGVMPHPNALGPTAAIAIVLIVAQPPRFWPAWFGASAFVLWLSDTRTMILIAPVAVLAILYQRMTAFKLLRAAFLLVGAAVLGLAALSSGTTDDLQSSPDTTSLNGRLQLWQAGIDYWKTSPIVGLGSDAFDEEFRISSGLTYAGQAHNQLISTLASEGLIGVIALATAITVLGRAAMRNRWNTGGASIGVFIVAIALLVVESPLRPGRFSPGLLVLSVLIVLAVARTPEAATFTSDDADADPSSRRAALL